MSSEAESPAVEQEYMYNVEIENKALAVFDTVDEALKYSISHVFLDPRKVRMAREALGQGKDYQYMFGFYAVSITPVAKRRMK